jgi:hypothetical protein
MAMLVDIAACSDGGFVMAGSIESSYLTPLIDNIQRAEPTEYRFYPGRLVAGVVAFLALAVIAVFGKQALSIRK